MLKVGHSAQCHSIWGFFTLITGIDSGQAVYVEADVLHLPQFQF